MGDDLAAGIQFVHALGQVVERDQVSAEIADLIFVRLAHVEDKQVLARVTPPLQFFDGNFRKLVLHRLFFPSDAAELLVINELGDGTVLAADRAIRVLAQLQLAELHSESVHQQQASDQRLARAQNQLDRLGGLHHAH